MNWVHFIGNLMIRSDIVNIPTGNKLNKMNVKS